MWSNKGNLDDYLRSDSGMALALQSIPRILIVVLLAAQAYGSRAGPRLRLNSSGAGESIDAIVGPTYL
jgi:hypothetical protein